MRSEEFALRRFHREIARIGALVGAWPSDLPCPSLENLAGHNWAVVADDNAPDADVRFAVWQIDEDGELRKLGAFVDRDMALYSVAQEVCHNVTMRGDCGFREAAEKTQSLLAQVKPEWAVQYETDWRALLANNPDWDDE